MAFAWKKDEDGEYYKKDDVFVEVWTRAPHKRGWSARVDVDPEFDDAEHFRWHGTFKTRSAAKRRAETVYKAACKLLGRA